MGLKRIGFLCGFVAKVSRAAFLRGGLKGMVAYIQGYSKDCRVSGGPTELEEKKLHVGWPLKQNSVFVSEIGWEQKLATCICTAWDRSMIDSQF